MCGYFFAAFFAAVDFDVVALAGVFSAAAFFGVVAVMHSGITLGPVTGRLVATELVEAVPAEQLSGVRPDRFRLLYQPRPFQPFR